MPISITDCANYFFIDLAKDEAPFASSFDPTQNNFASCWQTIKALQCLPPTGIASRPLAPCLCWNMWTARNNRESSRPDASQLQRQSQKLLQMPKSGWRLNQSNPKPQEQGFRQAEIDNQIV